MFVIKASHPMNGRRFHNPFTALRWVRGFGRPFTTARFTLSKGGAR